jgi:alkanesulfonate monooxygenase SsuD/methylene tetrahydromethanopterin reductase-like flavin-dependent oxidoreductase (luciferase family)
MPAALLAPLDHPLRLAEDLAGLDLLSGRRVDVVLGLGDRPHELAMFGVSRGERVARLERVLTTLRRAFAGELAVTGAGPGRGPTAAPGRRGVPASAERAARLGDGFLPAIPSRRPRDAYIGACLAEGREPGPVFYTTGLILLQVADDPDRVWPIVAPYVRHDMAMYARWLEEDPGTRAVNRYRSDDPEAAIRTSGLYQVVTPDDAVTLIREMAATSSYARLSRCAAGSRPSSRGRALRCWRPRSFPTSAQHQI